MTLSINHKSLLFNFQGPFAPPFPQQRSTSIAYHIPFVNTFFEKNLTFFDFFSKSYFLLFSVSIQFKKHRFSLAQLLLHLYSPPFFPFFNIFWGFFCEKTFLFFFLYSLSVGHHLISWPLPLTTSLLYHTLCDLSRDFSNFF